jgi:prepilin-type N-terminal cleavage/methylation domain-containing protein
MLRDKIYLRRNRRRGVTLIELLLAISIFSVLMVAVSIIYFSCLNVYLRAAWKLPPYDEATMGVNEMTRRLRDGMLIDAFAADWLVVILPRKDANKDNVLISVDGQLSLVAGNKLKFYLSDSSGDLNTTGNYLWMAEAPEGTNNFTPKKKIAENIHPELNPTDPATGDPQPLFRYYPDETRLWGVEMVLTSTANVHGELRTQTADTEVYLRNL